MIKQIKEEVKRLSPNWLRNLFSYDALEKTRRNETSIFRRVEIFQEMKPLYFWAVRK